MGDEIRMTVIATGFDRGGAMRTRALDYYEKISATQTDNTESDTKLEKIQTVDVEAEVSEDLQMDQSTYKSADLIDKAFDPSSLDVPAFLRRRS